VRRNGETVLRSRRTDHSRISDDEFSIEIREDFTSGFTEVIAQNRPGLIPPIAEIGLSDALVYVLCRISRPRVVVRSSDQDAQFIIRECNLNARTGLPDPIRGDPRKNTVCWNIFKAFLRQYVGREELSRVSAGELVYEVITASNGTVHGFIASLVLAIENLFNQLAEPPSEKSKEALKSLRQYLAEWSGDGETKERAEGLLSGLARRSPKSILKALESASVLRPEEVKSWRALRPKIAHGEIVDVSDEEIWAHRGCLITMFHRLILRTIGYRGPITDFSGSELQFVNFEWKDFAAPEK
jgi:hypothetical protein